MTKRPAKTTAIKLRAGSADDAVIRKIARRARVLYLDARVDRDVISIEMDLIATHLNGCPLRLDDLLAADDFNLLHDVNGISRHLNRETGRLENHFRPRFTIRAAA